MGFKSIKTKALSVGSLLALLFVLLIPALVQADSSIFVIRIGDPEESSSSSSSSSSDDSYNPLDHQDPSPAFGGSPSIQKTETPSIIPIKKLEKGEADFNDDNTVDCSDFSLMSLFWGSSESVFDLNTDGVIGGADLAQLLPVMNTDSCQNLRPLPELKEQEPQQSPRWLITQHGTVSAASHQKTVNIATKHVDDLLIVDVALDTGNAFINALDGTLNFSADDLHVLEIDYVDSGFNIWNQPPKNSERGSITFSGGVPGSGYHHGSVPIMTITFKVITEGSYSIQMDDRSEIYEALTGKTYTPKTQVLKVNVPVSQAPAKDPDTAEPTVSALTSSSHPDPFAWYNKAHTDISWELKNAQGAYVAIDQNPLSQPGGKIRRDRSMSQDLEDGIWYAHVRPEGGSESSTAHLRIRVDTAPPVVDGVDYQALLIDTKTRILADVNAHDELSGVSSFIVQENERDATVQDTSLYELQTKGYGKVTLDVSVTDKAGNTQSISSFVKIADEKEARRVAIELTKKQRSPATTLSIIIAVASMSLLFLWSETNRR